MLVRNLKVAIFSNANWAVLMQVVNDYTQGKAIPASISGTIDYPAGHVGEHQLVDQWFDGSAKICLFYA